MPKLGNYKVERIILPSSTPDDEAWVEVRNKIDLGTLADAYQAKGEVEQTLVLLSHIITDWNFTEDGTVNSAKVPVTVEAIRKFDVKDFERLSEWLGENVNMQTEGLSNAEKKVLSATSPVADKPSSQTSQPITSNIII